MHTFLHVSWDAFPLRPLQGLFLSISSTHSPFSSPVQWKFVLCVRWSVCHHRQTERNTFIKRWKKDQMAIHLAIHRGQLAVPCSIGLSVCVNCVLKNQQFMSVYNVSPLRSSAGQCGCSAHSLTYSLTHLLTFWPPSSLFEGAEERHTGSNGFNLLITQVQQQQQQQQHRQKSRHLTFASWPTAYWTDSLSFPSFLFFFFFFSFSFTCCCQVAPKCLED